MENGDKKFKSQSSFDIYHCCDIALLFARKQKVTTGGIMIRFLCFPRCILLFLLFSNKVNLQQRLWAFSKLVSFIWHVCTLCTFVHLCTLQPTFSLMFQVSECPHSVQSTLNTTLCQLFINHVIHEKSSHLFPISPSFSTLSSK